jgi:hypothetical protein
LKNLPIGWCLPLFVSAPIGRGTRKKALSKQLVVFLIHSSGAPSLNRKKGIIGAVILERATLHALTLRVPAGLNHETQRLQLREMSFPQGYLGLPEAVVVATEAYNDWWGTTDPIARKIRVCSWTLDHLCNDGQADTGLYIQVKDEKHRLLHEGGYAKSECGMCDFQPWDDLNA